jgi:DNA-binding MarR family transcriptional regulator
MELDKPGYNEAKVPTLALCHELGELTPGDLALMEGISPEAASMRLIRYHKWGLLNRTRQGRSYVYTITERGEERLEWLKEEYPDSSKRCRIIRDLETGEVLYMVDDRILDDPEELGELLNTIGKRRCKVEKLNP